MNNKITQKWKVLLRGINDIQSDSRKVSQGSLFVAIKGWAVDGHRFIKAALAQGATLVVCEEIPEGLEDDSRLVVVKDTAEALGEILSVWYNYPTDKVKLVGVTGTNGKTTIATLLYKMFRRMGHKVGLISTVCNYIDDEAVPTERTTPDPITLYALIDKMVKRGCDYVFMEVSSHAIKQKRIAGLAFVGGIFTNLTRDHLDYHKTVAEYLNVKKSFFDGLSAKAFALTNRDDKVGTVMLQNTKASKKLYSLRTLADYKGRILESSLEGMNLEINGHEVWVSFVGRFSAYNLLAVCGAAIELGKGLDEVLLHLSVLHSVAGRFETLRSPQGYVAIVDYAHTPDALENVSKTIKEVLGSKGSLITVVGCGGNRDKGKRPLMAKEAVMWSNQVILTSDNPRFEDPEVILDDMFEGLDEEDKTKTLRITDREQAIAVALRLAQTGDVILVAGKGHENYQEVKGVKHHLDDCEIIRTLFEKQK